MDGEDRFLLAGNNENGNTIMNPIMLRFRPIAPKPAMDGSVSRYSDRDNKKGLVCMKRAKRKYVRVKKNVKNIARSEKNNKAKEGEDWFGETVVTLELFPQIGKSSSENEMPREIDYSVVQQMNFNENIFHASDLTAVVPGFRVVESWVTMECVTDIFVEEGRLGRTDTEKVNSLKVDTCPGFVSDGVGGVRWVNRAYRRMVGASGEAEVVVWLAVMKERLPVGRGGFSCRVRVVYGKEKQTQTVPCDVWSMKFGGFAWRLDVEAALSLGR